MKDSFEFVLFSSIILFVIWIGSVFQAPSHEQIYLDIDTKAEQTLRSMSLEEKVGQLFMLGFWGEQPTPYILTMIKDKGIGGVILLGYNIDNEDQTKKLIANLESVSKYPLLISVDQEGGVVARIKFEDTYSIAQYEIQNEKEAYEISKIRGEELKDLGFNVNYSPVLDNISSSNSFLYSRSFRKSQEESSKLAVQMINGYQSSGILSCVKHFPGHSNETLDSHNSLDSVNITKNNLDSYIYQFKEPLKYADCVMMGHIMFPYIDSSNPTSMSEYFLRNVLRDDLRFNGIIITDDMEMKSITDRYTVEEAAVLGIHSGNDILLYVGQQDVQTRAYNAVLSAVHRGDISEDEINSKVLRILRYKYSLD